VAPPVRNAIDRHFDMAVARSRMWSSSGFAA